MTVRKNFLIKSQRLLFYIYNIGRFRLKFLWKLLLYRIYINEFTLLIIPISPFRLLISINNKIC